MKLSDYLKKSGETRASFATRIGKTPSFVTQLIGGTKKPNLTTALDIAAATGDAVPVTVWDTRKKSEKPAINPTEPKE